MTPFSTKTIQDFLAANRLYTSAFFFLFGFSFDLLTLGRIDEKLNILQQALFLTCSCFLIYIEKKWPQEKIDKKFKGIFRYHRETFHFLLGSLLSAYVIFFSKSAHLLSQWLFFLLIGVVILANETEFLKRSNLGPKVLILSLCHYCFLAILIPIMSGQLSSWFHFVAVFMTISFFFFFHKATETQEEKSSSLWKTSFSYVLGGQLFLTLLFLFKFIPPVPLSVQYMGVYHNVEKQYPDYLLYHEKPFYAFWKNGDESFNFREGDKVYCFVRIFSPANFADKIFIRWEKKIKGHWKTSDLIPMNITGGRSEGFRSVTFKEHFTPGDWRVKVESGDGREISRLAFEVINDSDTDERIWKVEKG